MFQHTGKYRILSKLRSFGQPFCRLLCMTLNNSQVSRLLQLQVPARVSILLTGSPQLYDFTEKDTNQHALLKIYYPISHGVKIETVVATSNGI